MQKLRILCKIWKILTPLRRQQVAYKQTATRWACFLDFIMWSLKSFLSQEF